ncbi:MAG: 16S rRNA (cytosine(967)-C(5))-methyltransferase RsmB [Rhodothermaceae bacterium]|nr:16S rRNA (cytosine(967)-C(5))-methyltransferase RsmB [Rhodothermaceae bacterium]MXX96793.1 16S rRNA (cytosine(967)-C(5))-methyltransferase RsmB [Rhodothermaceae bacterium]MXZ57490.1 16S rRNA (cytosine(967)-C(5))-methyltransferase RsmB [Rhodothermaceae bacterium]MYB90474.1 16S rRNA (cytosine(967)-C(5))-methyltransferase RsmB [Rhodothermaceae bacterium]MYC04744.1 16S rRNA (cytosine(967)-C(5))-methyltransferase RsmB [Rhodothermaceae bacterium]
MNTSTQSAIRSPNDRRDAVQHLLRITQDGAYRSLVDRGAGPRVVAFVSTVTRWRRYLLFLLHFFLKNKSQSLSQPLEQLLLLGIAEIVLLDEPPHAVVNETVNLARSMRLSTRLTNGVLRSVVRSRTTLPEPNTGNPVRDLAIRWSHPTWLTRRYVKRFGVDEATRLFQRNNEAPIYGIRVNQTHTNAAQLLDELSAQGIVANPSPLLEDYLQITSLGPLIRKGYMSRGVCSVHDESAGLVVALLDPKPDEIILDACAAPGGKALAAACRMQGSGQLHAWDIHPNRLLKVDELAHVQGLENIHTRVADLLDPPEMHADRVLLDVPCTGTGVMDKRADLRWRRREADLVNLTKLQLRLMDAAVPCVRPGGLLVYSTCSIEPEENELQVDSFLERHPNFTLERVGDLLPAELVTPKGYMATLPHRHGMDGAFAARLRKSR